MKENAMSQDRRDRIVELFSYEHDGLTNEQRAAIDRMNTILAARTVETDGNLTDEIADKVREQCGVSEYTEGYRHGYPQGYADGAKEMLRIFGWQCRNGTVSRI